MVEEGTFVAESTDRDGMDQLDLRSNPDAPERPRDIERSMEGIRWRVGITADPEAYIERERRGRNRKDLSPGQDEKRRSNKERPAQHPRKRDGLAKPGKK